ncbi:MAG: desulfoferrodoxin family protein [Bacillota bacterium]|nr:desulfoferrodoxin family protein [Bacillota bacterium]
MKPVFLKSKEEIWYLVEGKGENMKHCKEEGFTVLDPAMAEGAGEKHIPVVEKDGQKIKVSVGSVFHPMTEEHSIGWIFLETRQGGQFVKLSPEGEPVAEFVLAKEDYAIAAYAYCNLHGFWKTDISK